jgi:hypothetical protein
MEQCNNISTNNMDDAEDVVSFEEAIKEGERRIVFTGPRR